MVRTKKLIGDFYVLAALTAISGLAYYFYTWVSPFKSTVDVTFIVFSFFLVVFLWCYFKTLSTDPGCIPLYWGFKTSDPADSRKRYCVICNLFKPDWTHHCSTCNVCVLNMDHHCPWLNSCIGFWNWKSFILLLIYLNFLNFIFAGTNYMTFKLIFDEVSKF